MNFKFSKRSNVLSGEKRGFIVRKFVFLAAVAVLGVAATSCDCDDERQTLPVPEVETAPNTLSGVITDITGAPVQGATVTIGDKTATTNENGEYTITDIPQGEQKVTVTANGMFTSSSNVDFTAANGQNLMLSLTLNKKQTQTLVIHSADAAASGDIKSENIPNNEEGSVDITVNVPANSVPDNTTITITPIYTEETASVTRAELGETMVLGATVSCSDPNLVLDTPIDVVFALDSSVAPVVTAKEFDIATNTWRDVTPQIDANGNVVVKTKKFTSFGLFLPLTVTRTSSSEDIKFGQSLFDNRNGDRIMSVKDATFSYKAGTNITTDAKNKLEGLLIEYLARQYGCKVTNMTGSYPLNVNLEVGQGLLLKGTQAMDVISVSSNRTTVKGTRYGNVTVKVSPFSVDHNGGVVGGF